MSSAGTESLRFLTDTGWQPRDDYCTVIREAPTRCHATSRLRRRGPGIMLLKSGWHKQEPLDSLLAASLPHFWSHAITTTPKPVPGHRGGFPLTLTHVTVMPGASVLCRPLQEGGGSREQADFSGLTLNGEDRSRCTKQHNAQLQMERKAGKGIKGCFTWE